MIRTARGRLATGNDSRAASGGASRRCAEPRPGRARHCRRGSPAGRPRLGRELSGPSGRPPPVRGQGHGRRQARPGPGRPAALNSAAPNSGSTESSSTECSRRRERPGHPGRSLFCSRFALLRGLRRLGVDFQVDARHPGLDVVGLPRQGGARFTGPSAVMRMSSSIRTPMPRYSSGMPRSSFLKYRPGSIVKTMPGVSTPSRYSSRFAWAQSWTSRPRWWLVPCGIQRRCCWPSGLMASSTETGRRPHSASRSASTVVAAV